jgi:hypothetical protein
VLFSFLWLQILVPNRWENKLNYCLHNIYYLFKEKLKWSIYKVKISFTSERKINSCHIRSVFMNTQIAKVNVWYSPSVLLMDKGAEHRNRSSPVAPHLLWNMEHMDNDGTFNGWALKVGSNSIQVTVPNDQRQKCTRQLRLLYSWYSNCETFHYWGMSQQKEGAQCFIEVG